MDDRSQDASIKERIIGLLKKGYTRSQLINDFGFAERTVDAAIKAYKELDDSSGDGAKEGGKPTGNGGASTPKGTGKGAAGSPGRDGALAFRKEKESVLPEWLERDVAEIFDGQPRDQKIFLAGMSVPLMGLRLFAEGVGPIIELLATWQEGQAQAARVAQGSSTEIARRAGEAAAGGVAKFFMDTKPWLSTAPDPWKAMIVETMRPVMQQMTGQLIGGFMRSAPQAHPGIQSPLQGQAGSQSPPTAQPGTLQEATKEEIEEVFHGQ
jgi:hypothetical protein